MQNKKIKKYWLIKSEADCYSIDDLKKDKKIAWEGVRNFQARNFMKEMQVGDLCLFHHSNGTKENPTGVYGIAKVVSKVHPDQTHDGAADARPASHFFICLYRWRWRQPAPGRSNTGASRRTFLRRVPRV
jgi:predicted RNA-binding protein with PUA-like domain